MPGLEVEELGRATPLAAAREFLNAQWRGFDSAGEPPGEEEGERGIATLEPFRRRGIAAFLTGLAARGAFERGADLAVLTPGDEGAFRIHERSGFRMVETLLSYSTTSS